MRIISGKWKGRGLILPPLSITRPTTDRVREALFSAILSRIESFDGKIILDAFAGSGALGLESLSRGCKHVVFAEKNIHSRRVLLKNTQSLDCLNMVSILNDIFDIRKNINSDSSIVFDIVFMDPPYGLGLEFDLASALVENENLKHGSLIVLETDSKNVPENLLFFECIDIKRYGKSTISLWSFPQTKNVFLKTHVL